MSNIQNFRWNIVEREPAVKSVDKNFDNFLFQIHCENKNNLNRNLKTSGKESDSDLLPFLKTFLYHEYELTYI